MTTPPRSAFAAADTEFTPGDPPRPNFLPVGRVIIAFVVAAIIAGGLFGGHGYHHGGGIGWLVPVVVLCAGLPPAAPPPLTKTGPWRYRRSHAPVRIDLGGSDLDFGLSPTGTRSPVPAR